MDSAQPIRLKCLDSIVGCELKPILVRTLSIRGAFEWYIGFRVGIDLYGKAHHIVYFDGSTPQRGSIQHFDDRTSAHFWFHITEINRVFDLVKSAKEQWDFEPQRLSFLKVIDTLQRWGMINIESQDL